MQDMAKLQENDDRVSGSSKKTKLSQFFWSVLVECIFFLCTARGSAVLREEKRCQWEWESASEKLLINQCKDAAASKCHLQRYQQAKIEIQMQNKYKYRKKKKIHIQKK